MASGAIRSASTLAAKRTGMCCMCLSWVGRLESRPLLFAGRRCPLLLAERSVDRINEHVGRPWSGGGAKSRVVIARRLRGFDLLEGLSLLDGLLHAAANDRDHVAVVRHICQI